MKLNFNVLDITTKVIEARDSRSVPDSVSLAGVEYKVHSPKQVVVFERIEELNRFVADQLLAVMRDSSDGIIVPTGGTYSDVYKEMVQRWLEFKGELQKRDIANLDEVWPVDPSSPNFPFSYAEYMRAKLFEPMGLDEGQWLMPDGKTMEPKAEAERVEDMLGKRSWAIAMLGIGPDAREGFPASSHIGFTPNGTPPTQGMMFVQLDGATYDTNRQGTPDPDHYFTHAITQGPKDIARAKKHLLVAKGDRKKMNIRNTLIEPVDLDRPSSQVLLYPETTIVLDQLAARELLQELDLLS